MKGGPASPARSAEIEFKLADLWRTKGQIERAVAGFKRAIHTQPGYLPAYLELIHLFRQQEQYGQAIAWCRRAIEQHRQEPGLHQQLEKMLLKQAHTGRKSVSVDVASSSLQKPAPGKRGRLLFYTDCSGTFGVEQWNHSLMCGLNAAGYSLACAQGLAHNHLIEQQLAAGIDHFWLADDDLYDPGRTPLAFSNIPEAEAVFSASQPDLVLFSSGSPVSNLAAKEVALRMRIPFLVVVHCVTTNWSRQFDPYIKRLRDIHERAREVVMVSQNNLGLMRQHFCLAESKGEVILNGVRPAFFEATRPESRLRLRRGLGIADDHIVVLTVARLAQTKGYQFLLEVAAQLRQQAVWTRLRFVWVGSGSFESRLRVVADSLGVSDKILFLGERTDIPELLGMADVFTLTSQFEGMPLAVMEAMAKGLPVLATAVGGVADQMGTTGQLLPPAGKDPQVMVQAAASTLEAWAECPGLRRRIGQAARKRAEALFREERMLSQYIDLIEQSLERP